MSDMRRLSNIKWIATGVDGHTHHTCGEWMYTSDAPPVEADEYERMKARAEAAEQLLMVYRVLLTGAMAAAGFTGGMPPVMDRFADAYFTELFQVALYSGAFTEAGCGTGGIVKAAEQLHVRLPFAEE